jgi:hypothetical protein
MLVAEGNIVVDHRIHRLHTAEDNLVEVGMLVDRRQSRGRTAADQVAADRAVDFVVADFEERKPADQVGTSTRLG